MSFAGVKDCVGRYRGRKPPGRSRAAALAQRIVACDNPYWVLPDAEPRRIAASLPSPAEKKILKLSGKTE